MDVRRDLIVNTLAAQHWFPPRLRYRLLRWYGIDVASKAQIYDLIDGLVTRESPPKAVLMVSSYLPELLGVCDRIAVMCRGRLGPARPASEWTEASLVHEAGSERVLSEDVRQFVTQHGREFVLRRLREKPFRQKQNRVTDSQRCRPMAFP